MGPPNSMGRLSSNLFSLPVSSFIYLFILALIMVFSFFGSTYPGFGIFPFLSFPFWFAFLTALDNQIFLFWP